MEIFAINGIRDYKDFEESMGTYAEVTKLQKSVLFNYAGLMIHIGAVLRPIARSVKMLIGQSIPISSSTANTRVSE